MSVLGQAKQEAENISEKPQHKIVFPSEFAAHPVSAQDMQQSSKLYDKL
jgi:hypothetical protein